MIILILIIALMNGDRIEDEDDLDLLEEEILRLYDEEDEDLI